MNAHWKPLSRGSSRLLSGRQTLAVLTGLTMLFVMLLGGASRGNLPELMIAEIGSLPLLAFAVWRLGLHGPPSSLRWPLWIVASAFATLLLQLLPLPYAVWSRLPGHGEVAQIRAAAAIAPGWAPISLLPSETLSHLLALLPPAAVFLGTALLSQTERKWLTLAPLSIAVVSISLGAAQVASGPDAAPLLYATTNADSAVGIFANRNHQASLLVTCLPLAALWVSLDERQRRRNIVPFALAIGMFIVEIVGLVIVKSRAGVVLLVPAIIASLFLIWRGDRGRNRRGLTIIGGVIALILVVALGAGIGPLLDRFTGPQDGEYGGRATTALTTFKAALEYLPFGSGGGTFVPVFAGHELIDRMGPKFWNHAHNDFMELFLETGLLGLAAILAFIAWFTRRTWLAWFRPTEDEPSLAAGGSIVVGLLLLHSTIDYPLRSLTMAVVFAFACGLMVTSPRATRRSER